jgi:hypothetical protein
MLNQYGERHLSYVRIPLASINEGAAADGARLVDVRLWAKETDALPSELRLVFEHENFPVCLAGLQIPEIAVASDAHDTPAAVPEPEPEPEQPAE